MRVFFIGDIVGSPGREIVRERLADVVSQKKIDLVIANGENSASGFGITPKIVDELLRCGVEVISGGNHSWDRRGINEVLPHETRGRRAAKFSDVAPGGGVYVGTAQKAEKGPGNNPQGQ